MKTERSSDQEKTPLRWKKNLADAQNQSHSWTQAPLHKPQRPREEKLRACRPNARHSLAESGPAKDGRKKQGCLSLPQQKAARTQGSKTTKTRRDRRGHPSRSPASHPHNDQSSSNELSTAPQSSTAPPATHQHAGFLQQGGPACAASSSAADVSQGLGRLRRPSARSIYIYIYIHIYIYT